MGIARFSAREPEPKREEDVKPVYKKRRARVIASVWEKGRGSTYNLTCGLQIEYRDADNKQVFGKSFTITDLKDMLSLLPEVIADMESAMAEELQGSNPSDAY